MPNVGKNAFLFPAVTLFLAVISIGICLAEQAEASLEFKVKAAYILNVMKLIPWDIPAENATGTAIVLGVMGDGAVGDILMSLPRQEASGHSLRIEKIASEAPDLGNYHLVFISKSEEKRLPEILKRVDGTRVLTVSDIPLFARKGGAIGFIIESGRVKIEINTRKAKTTGLKIPAKLLEVARVAP